MPKLTKLHIFKHSTAVLLISLLTITADTATAKPMTIKVATVAPKGSMYHQALQEMGEKWRSAQGKDSRFIIYTNGSQGTEADAVRRMRVGQIHAAMLTVNGLMEIDKSVVSLQLMPLVFRSWSEVDYVREGIRSQLEQKFENKGYKVLFWGEGGWVQFFSNKPRLTPKEYKTARIFTWSGTKEQATIMKSINYQPVVLELNDIVPSVQTGMIDVVPVAPMWALAGQFYLDVPHMLRMNWVPIVGATLIRSKTWQTMRPEARKALAEAAKDAGKKLRAYRDNTDEMAIKAMQKRGLIVHNMTPEQEQEWQDFIKPVWQKIRGTLVPEDMFDKVQSLLSKYRSEQQ